MLPLQFLPVINCYADDELFYIHSTDISLNEKGSQLTGVTPPYSLLSQEGGNHGVVLLTQERASVPPLKIKGG